MTTAACSMTGPCQVVSRPMLRTTRLPGMPGSGLPGGRVGAGLERHAYADVTGGVEGDLVARVGVPDHPGRRVVGEHQLEAAARVLGAVGDHDDTGMDRLADADAAAVVDRHPRRT